MMALARDRTLGAHPYMVPAVEYIQLAREQLGESRLLAPELSVILELDTERARVRARADLELYLGLPNYTREWLRLGFTEADLAGGGSDRLVESLYVWGSPETIAERMRAHHDAGADHVCLRVVTGYRAAEPEPLPIAAWRELAPAVV